MPDYKSGSEQFKDAPKEKPSHEISPALMRSLKEVKGMDTESAINYVKRWKDTFGRRN